MPLPTISPRRSSGRAYRLALITALLSLGLTGLPLLIGAAFAEVNPQTLALAWNAATQQDSTALAWGDVDNDGDLDLVVGNYNQASQLYVNTGGTLTLRSDLWNPAAQPTRSLAWADVDGDGDLDLALGNEDAPSQLYVNNGGALTLSPAWTPPAQPTYSLAWGDVDGNGYPDLAVGNYSAPSQLYLNTGGTLSLAGWAPPSQRTTSLAWADIDNDGDLDLAVGNDNQPARVYTNSGGLTTTTLWVAPANSVGPSIALGDSNGDGDPDLIIGNNGGGGDLVQIFRSCALVGPGDAAACPGGPASTLGAVATLAGTTRARSLAIGDIDGDGRLDLLVGRDRTGNSLLFLNPGGDGSYASAINLNVVSDTSGLALADVDSDSDLDLAVANFGQSSQLFRNAGGELFNAGWAPEISAGTAAAWGDVDGNGYPDLAVGNAGQPNRLYLNTAGALTLSAAWNPAAQPTSSLAWGDVDNDGDLDLVVGNDGAASQLYVNTGGTLTLRSDLWNPAAQPTRSLAWGDADGDGDLDLALGNYGAPSQLYVNNGGALTLSPAWAPPAQNTTSLAWGDVNGDSDLDLALGNNNQPNRLYLNTNGALALDSAWQPASNLTASLAWADLNGDGQFDLVVGNEGQPNQIYRNSNGVLALDSSWVPGIANTRSIALADLDGDGDLDLAVGNAGQASQLYLNNGAGGMVLASWAPEAPTPTTRAVAWGDVDNDGDPDLALITFENGVPPLDPASRLYLNGAAQLAPAANSGASRSFNRPPTVSVSRPDSAAGGGLSAARISGTPTITIGYTLADPEGDPVAEIRAFYSLDDGGTWRTAVPAAGTQTTNLSASAAGLTNTFVWDTAASDFYGQSDTVRFRIQAYVSRLGGSVAPGSYLANNRTPGPFQRAFGSGTSDSFRARGIQVRVIDENGAGVGGALVYRLPAGASRGGQALADNTGAAILTNGQGYVGGRGIIGAGDHLAALVQQPVNEPYASEKYRLFYTSPIAIDTGIPAADQKSGNLRTLVVPRQDAAQIRPLILLDLNVGTEWDARNDVAFYEQLQADLRRASELLYDWTDGQVALGNVDIFLDGVVVAGTDVRIYASNRMRPGADPGGIVRNERPGPNGLVYTIGNVSIGSSWSRYGGAGNSTGEDWPRALAHELAHFALYLEDNYIGRNADNQLVTIPEVAGGARCPGAMSSPYNEIDSEFTPQASWGAPCANTFSQIENGRSDWATILTYYPMLRAPASYNQHPGPNALSLAVTQFAADTPEEPNPALGSPSFALVQANQAPYLAAPTARVRAILYSRAEQRAIDLGRPNRDQLLARGAQPGDRVCLYNQPERLLGCTSVAQGQSQLTVISKPDWNPDITITPLSDRSFRVSLPADSVGADRPAAISVRIYPRSLNTSAEGTLRLLSDGRTYSADIALGEPTGAALVRLWVPGDPDQATRREAVTDLTLYGTPAGSTITLDTHKTPSKTPTSSGNGSSACPADCAPVSASSDGQMLIYADPLSPGQYYSTQTASVVPTPPAWGVVIGQAYRLVSNMSRAEMQARRAAVNISYLESELPAGTEGGLGIYLWDGSAWRLLPSTRNDTDRNEVAVSAAGPGLYALIERVEVRPGWNYVSYPWPSPFVTPASPQGMASDLYIEGLNIYGRGTASAAQNYTTIHSYLPQDGSDPWKVFDVDVPFWVNDLRQLEYGEGYWFIVPQGGATPPQLAAAPEQIGVPVPPATFYGVLPYRSAPAEVGLPVQAISNGVVCSSGATRLVDGAQVGFLIEVRPAGQGAVAGCGINGQLVTIVVGGVPIGSAVWDNARPITFRDTYLPIAFGSQLGSPGGVPSGDSDSGASDGPDENDGEQWIGEPIP